TRPSGPGAVSVHAPTVTWIVTPRASLATMRTGSAWAAVAGSPARPTSNAQERAARARELPKWDMGAMSLGSAPHGGNPRRARRRALLRSAVRPARLFRSQPRPRTPWSQPLMRILQPFPRSLRVLLRGAAVVALLSPGTPSAQKAAPAPAAKAPQASKAPAAAKPAHPLPDSVLMRIDDREDVTVRRFQRAVGLLGGDPDSLTPAARDQFLDLVLEQRVLAAHAVKAGLPWTAADSARYRSERDNTLLRAALSDRFTAVENKRRAAGLPDLDEEALGPAARESLMVELKPIYDEDMLRRVGSAF